MEKSIRERRERRFICLSAAAAMVGLALTIWFAVPFSSGDSAAAHTAPEPIVQSARVDLNHDGLDALCTLPGIGESKAQAILDYRRQYGAFRHVEDAANVPGITAAVVDSWDGLAYVG